MSVIAIVAIVVIGIPLLLFLGGLIAARRRSVRDAGQYAESLAGADQALEQARAADRGWDRELIEAAARDALRAEAPDWSYERLDLVLVDDRPGVEEDRAHFLATGAGDSRRVVRPAAATPGSSKALPEPAGAARAGDLIPGFEPENDLEEAVTCNPEILRGLAWGKPRRAHPEGAVGHHVADLLERIEATRPEEPLRSRLRFVAIVHDALKFRVIEWLPHWGPNHHGHRARRVAESYTQDAGLLGTIDLHDRPYGIWRRRRRRPRLQRSAALDRLVARITDAELFVRFVELDGSTEEKNPEPIRWFREELAARGVAVPRAAEPGQRSSRQTP